MDCAGILLSLNRLLLEKHHHAVAATVNRDALGVRRKRTRIFSVI